MKIEADQWATASKRVDGRERISALKGGVASEKPLEWAGVFHYRGSAG
jgi:hypothetical protein